MTNTRQRRLQDEWLGLQRCRALTLASLRSLNEQLEDIRPELRDPPPLDGFTDKIGAPKLSQDLWPVAGSVYRIGRGGRDRLREGTIRRLVSDCCRLSPKDPPLGGFFIACRQGDFECDF